MAESPLLIPIVIYLWQSIYLPLRIVSSSLELATLDIIQLLIDAAPDSVRRADSNGDMPLHLLCMNKMLNDAAAMPILKWLLEKYPEVVRHADNRGWLPIHVASQERSPEFCRLFIEAYPGSEQIPTADGSLPLHIACDNNNIASLEYVYRLVQTLSMQQQVDFIRYTQQLAALVKEMTP